MKGLSTSRDSRQKEVLGIKITILVKQKELPFEILRPTLGICGFGLQTEKKVSRLFMISASLGGYDLPKDITTGVFFAFHFKIGCLVLISNELTCVAFAIVQGVLNFVLSRNVFPCRQELLPFHLALKSQRKKW